MARTTIANDSRPGLYTVKSTIDGIEHRVVAAVLPEEKGPPGAVMTSPKTGQEFQEGSDIPLEVQVKGPGRNDVVQVEFFRDAVSLGVQEIPEINGKWRWADSGVPAGTYNYTAEVTYEDTSTELTDPVIAVVVNESFTAVIVTADGDFDTPAEIQFLNKCPGLTCMVSCEVETDLTPPGAGAVVEMETRPWESPESVAKRFAEVINKRGDNESGSGDPVGQPYNGCRIFAAGGPESNPATFVKLSNLQVV